LGSGRQCGFITLVAICVAFLGAPALGQFETRSSFPFGYNPLFSIAVGDFDGDGRLDVAALSYLPIGRVTILLGNGDGTFHAGATYNVGVQPFYIVSADFRHNGRLDLAITDSLSGNIWVMLGTGDGTFQKAIPLPVGGDSYVLTAGDFNNDGKLDIIARTRPDQGQCSFDCITVLPGNADGTFDSPINTPVPHDIGGVALAAGHFNADGNLDVAVAGESQVALLLGNGDGTFRTASYYSVLGSPQSVAVADFNGDKKDDLEVSIFGNSISIFLGNGDGTFQQTTNYVTDYPEWVVAQDLDGDGKIDLAAANAGGPASPPASVSVFKGNGDGTFQPGVVFPTGLEGNFIAVGDFNGDHQPDLVATNNGGESPSDSVVTLLNTGVVSLSPTTPIRFPFQLVGTTSPPQTITLTNNGSSALSISSISVKREYQVKSSCGSSVASGASCTLDVTFSPRTQGMEGGNIYIRDSASSKPQVIELRGAGTVVELSPLSLNFGTQKVGTQSASKQIQLINTGTAALTITKLIDNGSNSTDFPQTTNCPSSLNAGASCTVTIIFKPQKTGTRNGVLSIADNGGGSPQTVPITGTGD
jgi:hypothetical protein